MQTLPPPAVIIAHPSIRLLVSCGPREIEVDNPALAHVVASQFADDSGTAATIRQWATHRRTWETVAKVHAARRPAAERTLSAGLTATIPAPEPTPLDDVILREELAREIDRLPEPARSAMLAMHS